MKWPTHPLAPLEVVELRLLLPGVADCSNIIQDLASLVTTLRLNSIGLPVKSIAQHLSAHEKGNADKTRGNDNPKERRVCGIDDVSTAIETANSGHDFCRPMEEFAC